MSPVCMSIYRRRIREAKDDITRIRIVHAKNQSVVAGPNVVVRWSCDLPPHLKMAVAMMAKLRPARTISDLSWYRRK